MGHDLFEYFLGNVLETDGGRGRGRCGGWGDVGHHDVAVRGGWRGARVSATTFWRRCCGSRRTRVEGVGMHCVWTALALAVLGVCDAGKAEADDGADLLDGR